MNAVLLMVLMFGIFPAGLLAFGLAMEKWANRNDEALCAVCNATSRFYSVIPNELCDKHRFEWAEEKNFLIN